MRYSLSKDTRQSPVSPSDGNMKIPISPIDFSTGSDYLSLDNTVPLAEQVIKVKTHLVPSNLTFTLFAEAQTWGVSGFKKLIINIEK